ncbi:MAG: CPBP family glutamic-type intramembrane protease [Verrucomicrobiota bacterium]
MFAINLPYNPLLPIAQATAEASGEADNLDAMQNDPLMIIATVGIAIYVFKLWLDDFKANQAGKPTAKPLPGAYPAPSKAIWIGVIGALIILGIETGGEIMLGLSAEQSDVTVLALFSWITAAFIEELIFRGFLVVDGKGTAALVGSIIAFSLLFTLLHPFFWKLDMPEGVDGWQIWQGTLTWDFSSKAWFTSAILFINSLWFYTVRFWALNPQKSLIPCMAAHFASNLGVFAVKLVQGHVVGLY